MPTAALALVLDADDGAGNVTAPADDPGFDNVIRRLGGPSVVYLGDRWVLTAHHVGAGVVQVGNTLYDPIPSSIQRIQNEDGSLTDLLLFQIDADPGLPRLALAGSTPRLAEDVVLVGFGASRGMRTTLDTPPHGLRDGFAWEFDEIKRWGTNTIADAPGFVAVDETRTLAIPTVFDRIDDPMGTPFEAQAAHGDSGGALFAHGDRLDAESGWVLAGMLFTVGGAPSQPPSTSFYGDITFAADIAHYRTRILEVVRPACLSGKARDHDPALACGPLDGVADPTPNGTSTWRLVAALGLLLALAGYALRHGASPPAS